MAKTIYCISCNNGSFFKIGITNDVKRRIKTLQTGNPHPLKFEFSITSRHYRQDDIMPQIEKAIHERLDYHRVSGEWFEAKNEVKQVLSVLFNAVGFHGIFNCKVNSEYNRGKNEVV